MTTYTPPRPDQPVSAPQQRRSRAWIWATIAVIAVGLWIVGSAAQKNSEPNGPVTTIQQPAPVTDEVSAFVDSYEAQNPGTITEFCGYADDLGPAVAQDAFVAGFVSEYPDRAYAIRVFNELLSRC